MPGSPRLVAGETDCHDGDQRSVNYFEQGNQYEVHVKLSIGAISFSYRNNGASRRSAERVVHLYRRPASRTRLLRKYRNRHAQP